MHACISRARDPVSAHACTLYIRPESERGGGCLRDKTLCSNLAPEEGGGFILGGCIIKQMRYIRPESERGCVFMRAQ